MWKSFFLSIGIFLIVLGAETLVIDKFVMADGKRVPRLVSGSNYQPAASPFLQAGYSTGKREILTKDWMPWSLLAGGILTVMYTCSVHGRAPAEE